MGTAVVGAARGGTQKRAHAPLSALDGKTQFSIRISESVRGIIELRTLRISIRGSCRIDPAGSDAHAKLAGLPLGARALAL